MFVFSIRKCTGSAESTHDGAAFAVNTGLDLITINGTFTVLQRMSYLKTAIFKSGLRSISS